MSSLRGGVGVALVSVLGVLPAACGNSSERPTPTMQPTGSTESTPVGPVAQMPTAPWPTMPSTSGPPLRPTMPAPPMPTMPTPPPPAFPSPPTYPGALPPGAMSADDARIRAALNGTWVNSHTQTNVAGRSSESNCRLVIHPGGATETCRSVTTLSPSDPPWPCRGTREPHVRTTQSPYAVSIMGGSLTFTPGVASVLNDNDCTPRPAGTHTTMTGYWNGVGASITLINNGDPSNLATYVRSP